MTVTVCSIFRDSAAYVPRYFAQMADLAKHVDLRLVLTYGDCTDDTEDALETFGAVADIARFDHGGPKFGSVDHPERWHQIAKVVRFTLDRVGDTDALLWVESDLIWSGGAMKVLLDNLKKVPAVAPRVVCRGTDHFYDVWGYRKNGQMFFGRAPYHPKLGPALTPIDSCGSCFATTEDHWRTWMGHWPYTAGGQLHLDPTVTLEHP